MKLQEAINGWRDGTVSDRDMAGSLGETATSEDIEKVVDHVLLHTLLEEEFSAEAAGAFVDLVSNSDLQTIKRRSLFGPVPQWGWTIVAACFFVVATVSLIQFQQSAVAAPTEILRTTLVVHKQSPNDSGQLHVHTKPASANTRAR